MALSNSTGLASEVGGDADEVAGCDWLGKGRASLPGGSGRTPDDGEALWGDVTVSLWVELDSVLFPLPGETCYRKQIETLTNNAVCVRACEKIRILFRRRLPELIYLWSERRLQEGHSVFRDFYPISGRQEGVEAQDKVWVAMEQLRHAVYYAWCIDTAG